MSPNVEPNRDFFVYSIWQPPENRLDSLAKTDLISFIDEKAYLIVDETCHQTLNNNILIFDFYNEPFCLEIDIDIIKGQ